MSEEVNISNTALEEFLSSDLGDFLKTTKNIDKTINSLSIAKNNGDITPAAITEVLEEFLVKGSSVLDTMTIYCNNMPDAESVNAFSALLNALASSINNVATLYKHEQSHRNKLELEEKKHELKLKEIEFRERLRATAKEGNSSELLEEPTTMIEVNTANIVNELINAKKLK